MPTQNIPKIKTLHDLIKNCDYYQYVEVKDPDGFTWTAKNLRDMFEKLLAGDKSLSIFVDNLDNLLEIYEHVNAIPTDALQDAKTYGATITIIKNDYNYFCPPIVSEILVTLERELDFKFTFGPDKT